MTITRHHTALAALLAFVACGPSASDSADGSGAAAPDSARSDAAQLAVASGEYANPDVLVDTEWVLAHLDDPTVHLIDVSRQREAYDEGHLPGARFVQWNSDLTNPDNPVEGQILTRDAFGELMGALGVANDHTVVVYDDTRNLFAARAYWVLAYYRHADVRLYNGGRIKWVADGQDLVAGPDPSAAPAPTRYVAGEPDPEIATDWEQVVASVGDPSTLYCDTRSPAEHSGEDARAERGGNIPGSVNLEWTHNVRDDGTFHDARALADLYQGAGFTRDRAIVTYCQTGVRGAHAWFVLSELLGYPDVRNYDGSWAEYGNRAESPIR